MRPLIGASWKMHLTPTEAASHLQTLVPLVADIADRDLFVLPAFPALHVARELLAGTNLAWGAQDVHPEDQGPFTGDVSAPMLADLGARYVEVGHPERRRDHGETRALVARKVMAVLRWGMQPVVCIGEEQRDGATVTIGEIGHQLDGMLHDVAAEDLDRVVVAYEPLWAIGAAGTPATPYEVGAVHAAIHTWVGDRQGGLSGARGLRVIYGGSVDVAQAEALLATPGVDGLFVGRAALDPARFAAIAHTRIGRLPGHG